MKDTSSASGGGIGFCGGLGILFIALKIVGVINWSWIWVLGPLWIPTVVFLLVMFILAVVAIVIAVQK